MTKTLWTKDFIRITLATSLGAAGGIISGFALSFLVFDETGSTLASALVVAVQLLPGAVLPLPVRAKLPSWQTPSPTVRSPTPSTWTFWSAARALPVWLLLWPAQSRA